MVDELPQQKFLVARIQIEQQTGPFDGFEGAMSFLLGEPLKRPT